jgi:hypothetical protein
MNIEQVLVLISETDKLLKRADKNLKQLAELPNPPHSLLVVPTVKLRGKILKDMEDLLAIKDSLE